MKAATESAEERELREAFKDLLNYGLSGDELPPYGTGEKQTYAGMEMRIRRVIAAEGARIAAVPFWTRVLRWWATR